MTIFHATPYDISAAGFYFEDAESYKAQIKTQMNDFGQPVEEFEIQFIDGEAIDYALCAAIGVSQANVGLVLDVLERWSEDQKYHAIAAANGGAILALDEDPYDLDVDLYRGMTLKELAEAFVDEGMFGEIPEVLQNYLDMEAIAHDLGFDYTEIEIAGVDCVYRLS